MGDVWASEIDKKNDMAFAQRINQMLKIARENMKSVAIGLDDKMNTSGLRDIHIREMETHGILLWRNEKGWFIAPNP